MKITIDFDNMKEVQRYVNAEDKIGQTVVIDEKFIVERWGEILFRKAEGTNDKIIMEFTTPEEFYEEKLQKKYEIPFWTLLDIGKYDVSFEYFPELNEIQVVFTPKV